MKYILLLAFLFLLCELSHQQNAYDYCKLKGDHSACKFTKYGPSCPSNAREDKPDEADKKAILDWHNSIRGKVASGRETGAKDGTLPKASNMYKLVWDDELAYIAQSLVNNCTFKHDSHYRRAVLNGRFFLVGQNIAYIATTGTLQSVNFVSTIDGFYTKEVKYFPKSLVSSFKATNSDEQYGHYTQVIWANTRAVGCGGVTYEDNGWTFALVVCNYGEAGNYVSYPVYKIGNPCSECPSGTSCSGSLCA
ncbi:UNVERIFIED_CONTAM: hypothetical protein RMT77_001148 [Armadillidium vulgare]